MHGFGLGGRVTTRYWSPSQYFVGFAENSSGGVGSGEWGESCGERGKWGELWTVSEDTDDNSLLPSPFSLLPNREVLGEG